jgi:hypothetical protein
VKRTELWPRLVDLVMQAHPHVVIENEHALRFVFLSGARQARVGIRVRSSRIYGEDVIVIAADLGSASHVDAGTALELNANLVHGTLIVDAGVLHLRSLVALDELLLPRLDHTVRLLALEACEIKRRIAVRQVAPSESLSTFGHYAE